LLLDACEIACQRRANDPFIFEGLLRIEKLFFEAFAFDLEATHLALECVALKDGPVLHSLKFIE
jgi:hypothetical protein